MPVFRFDLVDSPTYALWVDTGNRITLHALDGMVLDSHLGPIGLDMDFVKKAIKELGWSTEIGDVWLRVGDGSKGREVK